jgi:alginate O-acetyltransferase complex protein AlgI
MVFSSHIFLFYFLPLALGLYYVAPFKARTALIAVCSYVFYGWANPFWAVIMFFGSSVDYFCGLALLRLSGVPNKGGLPPIIGPEVPRTRAMKAVLVTSLVTNIGLLGAFKYTGFVAENVNALARVLGGGHDILPVLHLALPVGISFYTFKAMSYAIDVYRGDARPMRRFTDYMCFEAFFPDLVAGPIIRYAAMEEQMRVREHTLDKFARGVAFFALGMAKKILLANPMGHIADAAFAAGPMRILDAWFGVFGYAFQIYFDFSGYSDMAIGLALMMGFVLIQNFDSPYKSVSITDFWRRWHISLSTWLRDYLYIPLGGNRKGERRTYLNLMTVMLLGGLWHGASWNFVIWGGIHGGMLAGERTGQRQLVPPIAATLARGNHISDRLHVMGLLPCEDSRARHELPPVALRALGRNLGSGRAGRYHLHALPRRDVRPLSARGVGHAQHVDSDESSFRGTCLRQLGLARDGSPPDVDADG